MLRWLISVGGAGLLKSELAARARRAGRRAGLMAAAALLWLAAFSFAVGALVTWMAERLGAVEACGIIAAVLAVLALIIHFTLRLSRGARHRQTPPPSLGDLNLGEDLASANPVGMVVIIAVLGYLLGRQAARK